MTAPVSPVPERHGLVAEVRYRVRRLTGESYKFFHDFGALAGGQLLGKLLGFLVFAWLARVLEPETYGSVEYITGLVLFSAMVVDGGLDVIGIRRVAHDPGERPLLAFQIPLARLLLAGIGVPLVVVMAYAAVPADVPRLLIWLYALSLLAMPLSQLWLMRGSERMAAAAAADVLRGLVFASLIWLLVRSPSDVVYVAWAEVAGVTALAGYCLIVQHRTIEPVRLTGSFAGFGNLMKEGAAVGSTNMVWALNQYAPLFLIGLLQSRLDVAWYAAASRIVVALLTFSNIYHLNLYPSVTRATAAGSAVLAALLARSFRATAWAGLFLALFLALFAAPLVRITLGAKLVAAAPLLAVMGWMLPLTLLSGHARWSLVAAGLQTRVLTAQLAGLVVTLLFSVALGMKWGAMGFAIGGDIGFCAVWAASQIFALRAGIKPPSLALAVLPGALALGFWALVEAAGLGLVARAGLVALFAVLGPLLDRALIPDLIALGGTKQQFGRKTGVI